MKSRHQRRNHVRANLKHVQSQAQTFIDRHGAIHAGVGDGVNFRHAFIAVRRVRQSDVRQLINRLAADNGAVEIKEQRCGLEIAGNTFHAGV